MINERILNEFRQHNTTPEYIMLITDIRNGEVVCNEESLIISGKQIFTSLDSYLNGIEKVLRKHNIDPLEMEEYFDDLPSEDKEIIENYLKAITDYLVNGEDLKVIDKELTVFSNVILDDNDLYYGQLNGYLSKEENNQLESNKLKTQSSHYIEIVDTVLQKTIDITFNRPYKQQPKIYITIDEKYEYLYRNYTISPIDNGKDGDLKEYLGVQITFNNLKNTNTYPPVGVVIIGDEKTEEYDDEGNIKPPYHNLTVNLYYEEIDEETGRPIQIPIENTSVLINNEEYVSNDCGTITASLKEGEYEIIVKESGYRYTPKIINLNSDETVGLKLTPGITATFQTNLEDADGNTIKLSSGWNGTIDWGDGETLTFKKTDSFPMNKITHTYNDEETEHTIFIKTSDFKGAFTQNKKLTAISISNNTIKEFSVNGAFSGCSNLSSVVINAPIKTIPTGTFWACNFEKIVLPDFIETIGTAFGKNKALKNIVFPNSIKNLNIEGSCFSECTNLSQVIFSESITNLNIGGGCFRECTNLSQVIFPESMTDLNIGEGCFAGCTNLNQIDFPESTTSLNIRGGCFSECTSLNQIVFPESTTNLNIGGGCFSGCTSLNQIVFPESIVNLNINGALIGGTSIQQIIFPKTVNPYILPTGCISGSDIQQIILSDSITQLNTNSIGGRELHQISLPKSIGVISGTLSDTAFQQIILNWTNEDIIPWRSGLYGTATLIIPPETKNNYIAKGYPKQRLVERVSDEDDSS